MTGPYRRQPHPAKTKEDASGIDKSRTGGFGGTTMNEPSPYQPPATTPPPMPAGGVPEPSAVRVFGILHLILAGIGFLAGIWSMFASQLNNLFMSAGTPGFEAQAAYMAELNWVSVMSGVFMLILAILLLISGLMLVRSRPEGVAWSNRYAWTSIATKVISLVVTVVVVLPATQRMMDDVMKLPPNMPPGAADSMSGMMRTVTSISTVASPLISCLYPALALLFLSRQPVKDWVGLRRSGGA